MYRTLLSSLSSALLLSKHNNFNYYQHAPFQHMGTLAFTLTGIKAGFIGAFISPLLRFFFFMSRTRPTCRQAYGQVQAGVLNIHVHIRGNLAEETGSDDPLLNYASPAYSHNLSNTNIPKSTNNNKKTQIQSNPRLLNNQKY